MPTNSNDFPRRLSLAAKRAGLSQAALATIVDVSPSTVSDWYAGRYLPRAEVLMQLPEVLDVSGHWLLTGRGRIGTGSNSEEGR